MKSKVRKYRTCGTYMNNDYAKWLHWIQNTELTEYKENTK